MKRHKIWAGLSSVVFATSPAALASASPSVGGEGKPVQVAQTKSPGGEDGKRGAQVKGHGGESGETGHALKSRAAGEAGEAGRATKAKAGGGGEGGEGEGGEGGASTNLPANLRLYRDIELIRGHLLVGGELIEAGQWNEALPHFLHPQEEIYNGIRGQLKTLSVPPFLTALKSLAQTVKAKNKDAYAKARASVEERLTAVETAVQGKEANWPTFALESMLEVLQTATEEYEEAIEGSRISNVVEYQDARGFVLEAERLFQSIADELAKKNAEATDAVRSALNDLKTAWPSVQPPQAPVKDLGAVLSDVSKIELQLARLR
jgi:hypothetical protein